MDTRTHVYETSRTVEFKTKYVLMDQYGARSEEPSEENLEALSRTRRHANRNISLLSMMLLSAMFLLRSPRAKKNSIWQHLRKKRKEKPTLKKT